MFGTRSGLITIPAALAPKLEVGYKVTFGFLGMTIGSMLLASLCGSPSGERD